MKTINEKEEIAKAKKIFEKLGHKATLIQNTDRYAIIDWRQKNGSVEYYVNYIIDKKHGSLIISGDLGNCIASWHNSNSVHDIARYIRSVDYFISKFQCASDSYDYDEDDILEDIEDELKKAGVDRTEEFEDDWDAFTCDFSDDCYKDGFRPSRDRTEFLSDYLGDDWWDGSDTWGRRISGRVFLWIAGLNMAVQQLDAAGLLTEEK
ncbi:MAG: hypothetical protein SPL63_04745 [Roseburia faecis]|nr:hypothetical protein [Roseburia faecis]